MGFSATSISYIVVVNAFFLFSQISLHSAEEIPPKCFSFHCETFEKIKHSFSIPTNTICGFSVIYCDYYNPVINPLRKVNYTIDNKFFQGDTPIIKDPVLKSIFHEKRKKSCKFLPSFKEHGQPLFLYLTSKLRTLSKCNHTSHGEVSQNSNCDGDCKDCTDYELFFNTTSRQIQDIPDGCEVLRIPVSEKLPPFNGTDFKKDFLASLLAAGFNYHWLHIQEKSEHKTDLRKKLLIGFTSAAGAVFFCLLCFFIYLKCKKRSDFSNLMYRNTSFDPSKSDLEKASTYLGIPIFSYSELEEATEHFNPSKELGDGGFGTVYHGKLRDGRFVAIKRLYENNYKRVAQFMNEVHILTHLHHQNLVTLYGCTSRHSRELLLVYEFISNGTLADHLHGIRAMPGSLTWPIRMKIAIETASALAYLHASDIIHRDVKTNNILLDNNYCVKVADFGLSRLFPADATHVSTAPQGTPGYLDPEYHQCYQLTDKSDVYSFGVVLAELISSMPAVDISRHRHEINLAIMAINKIQKRLLHELIDPYLVSEEDYTTKRMIEAMAELAFQCLQYEKEMRPSMNEVLEKLKGIENENCRVENLVEVDFNELDEVDLLKSSSPPPTSPSSVTDKGISRYGT